MIFSLQQVLGYLQHLLPGLSYSVLLLALFAIALAFCFAGRILIKGLAFIIVGLILGGVGAAIGLHYFGNFGMIAGAAVGFVAGGFLGITLVTLGMGIALGYFGYSASNTLVGNELVSIIIGIVLLFVGIVVADQILSVATAILGGILLYNVMTLFGFGFLPSVLVAVVLGGVGIAVQLMSETHEKTITKTQTVQTTTINN